MQLVESKSHAAFDRAERNIRDLGDFPQGVAAVIREFDRFPLLDWQTRQRFANSIPLQPKGDLMQGIRRCVRDLQRLDACKVDLAFFLAAAATQLVYCT